MKLPDVKKLEAQVQEDPPHAGGTTNPARGSETMNNRWPTVPLGRCHPPKGIRPN